jgi:drug/metabolite transporter (DMT)-like permease/predicted RNase H-like HicB family nuclease
MKNDRHTAFLALTAAGLLWGTTVPLSRLALAWLPPGWLACARLAVAAAVLLVAGRRGLRGALRPAVLAWGAVGYGGAITLQNAGIARTSVSQAALLIGATPVLIAVIAAVWRRSVARPLAWAGFGLSLAGVGLVASGRGGGATLRGDGLVLASLLVSATFTVAQTRLLRDRDPVAVTGVQFLAAALATAPVALGTERLPAVPPGAGTLLATAALITGGTVVPFTLFAYGQTKLPAHVAGAFLNIEPLVGTVAGVLFFGDPVGWPLLAGGAAILAGITLSSLPGPTRRWRYRQISARFRPIHPRKPSSHTPPANVAERTPALTALSVPYRIVTVRANEDQRDYPVTRAGRLGAQADSRVAPALRAPGQAWTGYGCRQAKRYLEAKDRIEHPEAGGVARGAAVKGYVVVFEGDDQSGYSAYSPDLPGVVAAGATRQETEQTMLAAMAEHIALLREAGQPVPEQANADSVTILDPAAA